MARKEQIRGWFEDGTRVGADYMVIGHWDYGQCDVFLYVHRATAWSDTREHPACWDAVRVYDLHAPRDPQVDAGGEPRAAFDDREKEYRAVFADPRHEKYWDAVEEAPDKFELELATGEFLRRSTDD